MALAEPTGTSARRRQPSHLTVLVDSVHYPIDLRVTTDGLQISLQLAYRWDVDSEVGIRHRYQI